MSVTTNPYQAPASNIMQETSTYTPQFFAFSGRIGRLRYLAYSMFTFLFLIAFVIVGGAVMGFDSDGANGSPSILMAIVYVPVVVYAVVLCRRRLNDMNHSGWFSLLYFIPLANMIFTLWLVFGRGTATENRFGPVPTQNPLVVKIMAGFAVLIPLFGTLVAIGIPAYQDYVERSQISVSE